MIIKKLETLLQLAQKGEKRKVITAYAQDENTLIALEKARNLGFVDPILVGDKDTIIEIIKKNNFEINHYNIIHEPDEAEAGRKSVELINDGEGDIIMKGLISTDKYLKAILNKEDGLMKPKATLSHVALVEVPSYHKLLVISDAAFIPEPTVYQKIDIVRYVIETAHNLRIEKPKVALVSFTEKSNPKIVSCNDAAVIAKMGDRKQIKNAYIDGPLALDVAVDKESVKIKRIESEVAGDADCLVFPNLESGNVFYKSMTKLANGEIAAYVAGTKVPAILPSRGDSDKSKLYSLALACLMV